MMKGIALLGALLFVACDAPGTVDGTIRGETIEPEGAWYGPGSGNTADLYMLLLAERNLDCGGGQTDRSGESLYFLFCEAAIPGQYTITHPQNLPAACEDQHVSATVEQELGPLGHAMSGTVMVDAIDDHITGSFSLTFDGGDTLTGRFDAPVCEP